ncbi:VOC family protein [Shewanella aestuarii]|uniref:VOC family protein n=1 Tax=Shewanella aestuarii TaxID=1028752 RepID=A0A6G9QIP1_9GAMM|nr:VOC family protein [Shewanella aestuarii]QIR14424.1 VOC family protein [Shewanella aestuarii]
MYLEHLNLVVKDLQKSLCFYQAAMPHWQVRGGGESVWHGAKRNWIHFGDDYHYLSLNDSGTGVNRELVSNDIGLGHFAYVVNDLDALVARLKDAGFEVRIWGGNQPNAKSVYFIDPDGYEVEFVQYLSDIPSERNQYL